MHNERVRRTRTIGLVAVALIGCGQASSPDAGSLADAWVDAAAVDASPPALDGGRELDAAIDGPGDAALDAASDAAVNESCVTRVTYGSAWIHPDGHAAQYDDVEGVVSWDGVCHDDGARSYAELSNGARAHFRGNGACILALDVRGPCAEASASCATRDTYGASWIHPSAHPAQHDDVDGVVTWDGACADLASGNSSAQLSNGWSPRFSGSGACSLSFRHTQCGGLYENPVVPTGCPDPGVVRDGARYVMVCTSGNAAAAFPIRTSPDLIHWRSRGHVFPAGEWPSWASGNFWAPEIHRVGSRWVAYYTAITRSDGTKVIGAASATDVLGPYTDLGHPLLHDPNPGVIDATHFEGPDGTHYLIWKTAGAPGRRTPIHIQPLTADGLSLRGSKATLITNDLAWEGPLVEGPWMIQRGTYYYLFYSGNSFDSTRYAVGVARATSPLGPFTKLGPPILTSNYAWSGPGHGSVVRGPGGEWVHVYHAWEAGHVGEAPGRVVLVDRIDWRGGWPHMDSSPMPRSQPPP